MPASPSARPHPAMCTLILLHRCFDGVPIVVAANRDEYLARPAEAPAVRPFGARFAIAPLDVRAGGTWLGMNDAGLFVGLTNRPNPEPRSDVRSRGLVVADALAARSVDEALAPVLAAAPGTYSPFNLLVCDAQTARVVVFDGDSSVTELAPGAHVIGNADPNDAAVPKVARLLGDAKRVAAGEAPDALDALLAVLRQHDVGASPLEDTCIHAGAYGTRSTLLLRKTEGRQADELRFGDGPPCEVEPGDQTPLFSELERRSKHRTKTATRKVA